MESSRKRSGDSDFPDKIRKPKKLKKDKRSKKKRRKHSSPSDSSSENVDVNSSDSERLRKKHKKKNKKKRKHERKKEKRKKTKKNKHLEQPAKTTVHAEEQKVPELEMGPSIDDARKAMAPMTKEEWEKQQSVIRRVYDPETGRSRLIKGDGEVLEEIVSKERHKDINKAATLKDGEYFQKKAGLLE